MRVTCVVTVVLLLGLPVPSSRAAHPPVETPGVIKVLILFDEAARHIDLVAATRARIQGSGGRVRGVLGLAGLLAEIEPGMRPSLAADAGVQGIYDAALAPPPSADAYTLAAVAAWNRLQEGPPAPGPEVPGAPPTDVSFPEDVPADPEVREADEVAYRAYWAVQQTLLPANLQKSGPGGPGCGSNGAGFYDTSLYLAGEVAVGVFYEVGTLGGWTPSMAAATMADVVYALDQYLDMEPYAGLVFTYVNEVNSGGSPLPKPVNEWQYDNNLRNTWCTDWAYLVTVRNGGTWPNSQMLGPSTRLDRTWQPFDYSVRHETGHIFGAADEYANNYSHPTLRYGYLMAVHANDCSAGGGFFSGTGECLPDLMNGWDPVFGYNSMIGPFTAGELGWHDANGDGLLDVMETRPVIDGATVSHTAGNPPTYGGTARDRPLLDELASYNGSASINRIAGVQYRINFGAWQEAAPADGLFDSGSEGFSFVPPALPVGTYQVQIRAVNTVGRVTLIPYAEQLLVTTSGVTNTRPFGSLSVTPTRAKFGTLVLAFGGASRDLETPTGQLQYSWNWGDGLGFTTFVTSPTATHMYALPGTYSVQMRVRDAGGLFHLVSQTVVAESYNVSPTIAFSAIPENRHLISGPTYGVSLSVVGSRDGETSYGQIAVQWDADGNGVWDGPWSILKTNSVVLLSVHYPKSDRRRVRARIRDTTGNVATAERFIWIVPYNHRPAFGVGPMLSFTPSGTNYIVSVHATDADLLTTWDGMLEYRYDLDGDGIWDTTYDPVSSRTVPSPLTLRVEVKDRFHARITPSGLCPGGQLALLAGADTTEKLNVLQCLGRAVADALGDVTDAAVEKRLRRQAAKADDAVGAAQAATEIGKPATACSKILKAFKALSTVQRTATRTSVPAEVRAEIDAPIAEATPWYSALSTELACRRPLPIGP